MQRRRALSGAKIEYNSDRKTAEDLLCRWLRQLPRSVFAFAIPFAFLFAVAFGLIAWAPAASAARNYGPDPAYLPDTTGERESRAVDMVLMPPPPPTGPGFNETVFNDKLVKEFRDRYEEKFGRTEVDRVYNSPNRYTYYDDLYGFKGTPQQEDDEKRKYGDFVLRRLVEYHVDNYAQHDPKVRPAWEAKERLKDMKVEVGQVRFDVQYSLAGNTLDLKMNNPYFPLARARFQMSGGFISGQFDETTFSLGRNVTSKISMESHYKVTDGVMSVIARRALTASLGSTIETSTFTQPTGLTPRESKYLAGLSYVF